MRSLLILILLMPIFAFAEIVTVRSGMNIEVMDLDPKNPAHTRFFEKYEKNTEVSNILLKLSSDENYHSIILNKFNLIDKNGIIYNVNHKKMILQDIPDKNPYSKNKEIHQWTYAKGSFPYPYQNYTVDAEIRLCNLQKCQNYSISGELKTTITTSKKNSWLRGYG